MVNELYHHGIKGQKWGVRRYQNEDGTYTKAGRKRYGYGKVSVERNFFKDGESYSVTVGHKKYGYVMIDDAEFKKMEKAGQEHTEKYLEKYMNVPFSQVAQIADKNPKLAKAINKDIDTYMELILTERIMKERGFI